MSLEFEAVKLKGRLAISTIHGRNGDFNVGSLSTRIGVFYVKNPELEQYKAGGYDGEFTIAELRLYSYQTNGRAVTGICAVLAAMKLFTAEALTSKEAQEATPQVEDPAEEEDQKPTPAPAEAAPPSQPGKPKKSTVTPFPFAGSNKTPGDAKAEERQEGSAQAADDGDSDASLFGTLWPLSERFKLDTTVDRRRIRSQRDRLFALGYDIDHTTQEWYRAA
jgi:hypothetical protein